MPAEANASSAERPPSRNEQRVKKLKQEMARRKEWRRQEAEQQKAERLREQKHRLESERHRLESKKLRLESERERRVMAVKKDILCIKRKDRMTEEERLVKELRVRRMAQEEAIRKDRKETGFIAECRCRGEKINAIHDIVEQRIKVALQTGKKPPRTLTSMTFDGTTVSQAPGGGYEASRT